jgi:hypothetical protein
MYFLMFIAPEHKVLNVSNKITYANINQSYFVFSSALLRNLEVLLRSK